MLVLLRRPASSKLRSRRLFHSSLRASDYVGPPDPVSNIRPVLYDDPASTNADSATAPLRHPYSLDEFRDDADTLEYQWKLQRQQLDAFNNAFWRDVRLSHFQLAPSFNSIQTNTRFEAAKDALMSGLPPHATAEQREERLSEFYKNWVLQEARWQKEFDSEWRRRSMQEIKLAARVSYHRLKARITI
jgi:apoptogenic protein 1